MDRLPIMSCTGVTSMASKAAPITMSFPFGPRPSISSDIAFGTRGCSHHHSCAAQFLQRCRCIRRFAVDVDARSQLLCERLVLSPAPNRGDLITELLRKLNAQVTKPANTLDGNEVAGKRTAVAQRVEHSDAGAEQRRCLRLA